MNTNGDGGARGETIGKREDIPGRFGRILCQTSATKPLKLEGRKKKVKKKLKTLKRNPKKKQESKFLQILSPKLLPPTKNKPEKNGEKNPITN